MKVKKEYIVLAVVIAALVVYLAVHKTDRIHYELPELQKYPDTEITGITVNLPDSNVELRKKEGKWNIDPHGWSAEAGKVESMIDTIRNLEVTALVSKGKNYPAYNLGDRDKIHVTARADGKQIRSFDVGKTAPSSRHTFIRLPDDPRVYHASGNFREQFANTAPQLRDKTVLAFDKSAVTKIRIEKGKTVKELTLRDAEKSKETAKEESENGDHTKTLWKDTKGNEIARDKVNQLLSQVNSLECREFIGTPDKNNFKNPIYMLSLTADKGRHKLTIYPKTSENAEVYPAESSMAPDRFSLSKSRAEKIMSQLFEKNNDDSKT